MSIANTLSDLRAAQFPNLSCAYTGGQPIVSNFKGLNVTASITDPLAVDISPTGIASWCTTYDWYAITFTPIVIHNIQGGYGADDIAGGANGTNANLEAPGLPSNIAFTPGSNLGITGGAGGSANGFGAVGSGGSAQLSFDGGGTSAFPTTPTHIDVSGGNGGSSFVPETAGNGGAATLRISNVTNTTLVVPSVTTGADNQGASGPSYYAYGGSATFELIGCQNLTGLSGALNITSNTVVNPPSINITGNPRLVNCPFTFALNAIPGTDYGQSATINIYGNSGMTDYTATGWSWPLNVGIILNFSNNAFDQATVDAVLLDISNKVSSIFVNDSSSLDLSGAGNAAPSSTGYGYAAIITAAGVTCTTN